ALSHSSHAIVPHSPSLSYSRLHRVLHSFPTRRSSDLNKIKVASASAAVLASLILVNANLTNEVKADTKPANTSSKAQTPEEAAKANIASVQKEVDSEQANTDKAKAALDQAKKDAEKPDADYKAQNDKVDSLEIGRASCRERV